MSAPTPAVGAALVRRRIAGVAFLLVISSLVYLSVLLYQKAFTHVVDVSLKTDHIGNQLSPRADVKLRGLVVGTVKKVSSSGDGATIELALDPGKVKLIPENVTAQLLPKTLFGEKYVNLVLPATPVGELRDGDVIPQDRTATALETERVLNDLMPLLQRLRPQELSTTLNALSTALRGRGDRLGGTFASAGTYLARFNPSIPTLGADFQRLSRLADDVQAASPDLLAVLDNLSASSRNIEQERPQLDAFLTSTTGFAATARSIVAENETHLIRLAADSKPVLDLYARYSSEFPCFAAGLAKYEPTVADTFGGLLPGLHITVELTTDNGGYRVGQEPKYRDTRGPACWRLPYPSRPAPDDKFNDGYRTETTPSYWNAALAEVAAPALGVSQGEVPEVVDLLLGPVAAGHAVGLS